MGRERHAYRAAGSPHSVEAALFELASRQHGVVSRPQLLELGFSREAIRRRIQARRLERLHQGVYAVGHVALTPASHDLAAVLACGRQALLSHRAAGRRHGLLRSGGASIEVTAPRSCRPKPGILVHRSRLIHPDDRATVDGIPTTSVARTLVDLADVLDSTHLAAAVNEAEVLRRFDLTALEQTLARLPGRTGRHRLRRVLADYTEPPCYSINEAEGRLLSLCRRHGLPTPHRITAAGYELDFYWHDARLGIEVDGGAFHRTRRAFHEDRRRDRKLAAAGIQVARVTWRDLVEAEHALAQELHAIRAGRLRS